MPEQNFERSVFINCPFDDDYEPILQAILFCLVYLEFSPRIATEGNDSTDVRIQRIRDMVVECKYSIHDLSRSQAREAGEFFRLNMPFELGLDYGCKQFSGGDRAAKKILILEEQRYRYQATISDLAGCDIKQHTGKFEEAIRQVRNWLVSEAGCNAPGASKIINAYEDFQEWYYEKQLQAGFSDEDIQDYPTVELLGAMQEWVALGQPI